ncbi:DUF177 domain-containing protein [Paracoccus sp. (in: a-proteobacteria)]|uniref:YceD family protein n=1 Tax=Paracoccus sp. TaxID=267 RepID=UPI0026E02A89|nr:DUF177 domain-containing protein [Paracoccus sp. (in: a-proteobacteria)]MDO5646949.1 DUF177 domain-containing protein [Paracoccus sp. (in: a-proteobacteria)]
MTASEQHPVRLRVAHLNPNAPTPFALRPDGALRAEIAQDLGIDAVTRLDFTGDIRAEGRDGWHLRATLRARVTQACVVTLRPVKSDIDDAVDLHFSPHATTPDGDEVEMGDETLEPLGSFIDLTAIMTESLALSLPQYPRVDGAELDQPDPEPESGDTRRPFAGLDKLLNRDS